MPGEYDINQMREEAVRRAREMQSRARLPSRPAQQRGNPPERNSSAAQRETPREPPSQPNHTPQAQAQSAPAPERNGLLETLFQDKERTVLLALLLLLSEDESHHDLMFALMFLLM